MTRLNTGTHRVVRLVAAVAGVAAIGLASACGAGQIAETAKVKPAVPGGSGSATVPANPNQAGSVTGTVSVQNVTFDYSDPSGYAQGASAPLNLRVINGSGSDLVLTGVTATATPPGAQAATPLGQVTVGSPASSPAAAPSAPPSPSGSPSTGSKPSKSPKPSDSASPSDQPSDQPSAAPSSAPAQPASISIKIPANQLVDLSQAAGQFLEVSNLTMPLTPGASATLVFTFTDSSNPAGAIDDITVSAQIAPPTSPAPRATVSVAPSED